MENLLKLGSNLGTFGLHFGTILAPFLLQFGSMLGPFGLHFGSILAPFSVCFGARRGSGTLYRGREAPGRLQKRPGRLPRAPRGPPGPEKKLFGEAEVSSEAPLGVDFSLQEASGRSPGCVKSTLFGVF